MAAYISTAAAPAMQQEYIGAPGQPDLASTAATTIDTNVASGTTTKTTVRKGLFGTGPSADKVAVVQQDTYFHTLHNNPHDDWSSRDLLLSIIPYVIALAFKDAALSTGLIVATALSLYVLCKRFSFWGGYTRHSWPVIDVTNLILFAILLGLSWRYRDTIHKWIVIIASATLGFVALVSLLRRKPFTAHYARYSPNDLSGFSLWESDLSWRLHNDFSTFAWFWAWACATVLALAPALTGMWSGFTALNIIFDYIVPFLLMAMALSVTQLMGRRYSTRAGAGNITGAQAGAYAPGAPLAASAYAPGNTVVAVGPNAV